MTSAPRSVGGWVSSSRLAIGVPHFRGAVRRRWQVRFQPLSPVDPGGWLADQRSRGSNIARARALGELKLSNSSRYFSDTWCRSLGDEALVRGNWSFHA